MTEAAWNLREERKQCGSLDRDLRARLKDRVIRCSKNDLNGPTAKVCWKCGEDLKAPKQWSAPEGWRSLPYESPEGTRTEEPGQ